MTTSNQTAGASQQQGDEEQWPECSEVPRKWPSGVTACPCGQHIGPDAVLGD